MDQHEKFEKPETFIMALTIFSDMSKAQSGEERPWEKALRNPLVLQHIFQFLPTGFLLSSCSLVNKSWNYQTRTYTRDNRKCTVTVNGKPDEFLKQLDKFCGHIIANGRIVPFNSFNSNGNHCTWDSSNYEDFTTPNLSREMKVFHLDIECRSSWYRCRVHKPIFDFVQPKGNQLKSLKITQHGHDATLLEKIIETKPRLKTFSISDVPFRSISPANSDDPGHQIQQRLYATLEKLLQTSHQSLRAISIAGPYEGLGRLSHPPLAKLSKFRMEHLQGARDTEKFYSTVATIDYTSKMPRLREVEFRPPSEERTLGNRWAMAHNCCSTVRTLTLIIYGAAAEVNLPFFLRTFPNVSSLKITDSFFTYTLPFTKIWELLPCLEELEIRARRIRLSHSYDSDFCGIHAEEAKLLRENDEGYLQTAKIVPTNYNILSMKRKGGEASLQLFKVLNIYSHYRRHVNFVFQFTGLRKLRIDLKCVEVHSPSPDLNFISKVTELVVFWKMPHVDISVTWSLRRDTLAEPEEKYFIIQPTETVTLPLCNLMSVVRHSCSKTLWTLKLT